MITKLSLVILLLALLYKWFSRPTIKRISTTKINATYDYVIVGGGAAGTVLANRLSADSEHSILLLESGDEVQDDPMYDIPWNAPSAQMTSADWMYYTEPQKHACLGMKEQRQYMPRGRGLGGSTIVNGMLYVRANKYDFDSWANNGCEGWSYDEVFPYILKSEGTRIDRYKNSEFHSTKGEMAISDSSISDITTSYLKAWEQLGLKTGDYNGDGGTQQRIGRTQAIIGDSIRWHTARAFLWPVLDRQNLHVAANSHVIKVIIENKRAVGVEFIRNGRKFSVKANKEIIISAGAIGTPQLLLLSGIGPKSHLDDMKIPVKADLPVGNNVQDHVMFFVKADINESISITTDKVNSWWTWVQYHLFGSGYLSTNAAVESVGFACTDPNDQAPSYHCPDIEIIFFSSLAEHGEAYSHFNYKKQALIFQYKFQNDNVTLSLAGSNFEFSTEANSTFSTFKYAFQERLHDIILIEVEKEVFKNIHGGDKMPEGFTVALQTTHPKSKGTIRLKTVDPFDYPSIDLKYLEDPYDVQPMVRGVALIRKMLETKEMKRIGAKLRNEPFSKCSTHTFDSDNYWECMIRHLAVSGYHISASCKMGPSSDKTSVVDPKLRVHGIAGLRVVDASVFPGVTSGNTMTTTLMVAEKAADIIRGIKNVSK